MKALNVFAIIFAWILSIALVVMLIAAPLMLSALSTLSTDNIVELIGDAIVVDEATAAQPQDQIVLQNLSAAETAEQAPGTALAGLKDLVGDDEMFAKLLASDAVAELLSAYAKDVTNAIAGTDAQKEFTPELLAEVVQNNIDEIVEIVAAGQELTDEEKAQLKEQIQTGVVDKAEEIVEEMPSAEEIKESVLQNNQDLEVIFVILAMRNRIKGAIVGAIVLLCVLIFALRFPGYRGMRWLSTDLFVAGACNVVISTILSVGSSAITGVMAGANAMGSGIDGVVGKLLTRVSQGVAIRTVIMLVAAIVLLVVYKLLKKALRKKAFAEIVIPEAVPAFVPTPVAVETEQVVETENDN